MISEFLSAAVRFTARETPPWGCFDFALAPRSGGLLARSPPPGRDSRILAVAGWWLFGLAMSAHGRRGDYACATPLMREVPIPRPRDAGFT